MTDSPKVETRCLQYPRDLCDPKDWLNFVQLDPFVSAWKSLKLSDDDLRAVEIQVMLDPTRPPVVKGTGGVRKMRVAPPSQETGKSGGIRVLYVYFQKFGLVALVYAFSKGEREDISDQGKQAIRKLVKEIESYLHGRRK